MKLMKHAFNIALNVRLLNKHLILLWRCTNLYIDRVIRFVCGTRTEILEIYIYIQYIEEMISIDHYQTDKTRQNEWLCYNGVCSPAWIQVRKDFNFRKIENIIWQFSPFSLIWFQQMICTTTDSTNITQTPKQNEHFGLGNICCSANESATYCHHYMT